MELLALGFLLCIVLYSAVLMVWGRRITRRNQIAAVEQAQARAKEMDAMEHRIRTESESRAKAESELKRRESLPDMYIDAEGVVAGISDDFVSVTVANGRKMLPDVKPMPLRIDFVKRHGYETPHIGKLVPVTIKIDTAWVHLTPIEKGNKT